MQERRQGNSNIVHLSDWRARRSQGSESLHPTDPAIDRLNRARRAWRPEAARLVTALRELDEAVGDLGAKMSSLEVRVVQFHESLGHALTRLEAQRRQNAQVMACLESGDIAAMEDCRRRIAATLRAANPRVANPRVANPRAATPRAANPRDGLRPH